jgi:hypothetical protein
MIANHLLLLWDQTKPSEIAREDIQALKTDDAFDMAYEAAENKQSDMPDIFTRQSVPESPADLEILE